MPKWPTLSVPFASARTNPPSHYRGHCLHGQCHVEKLVAGPRGGKWVPLPVYGGELIQHRQPLAWGKSTGDGPYRLAMSILVDLTGDEQLALALHRPFRLTFLWGYSARWRSTSAVYERWILRLATKYGVHSVAPRAHRPASQAEVQTA